VGKGVTDLCHMGNFYPMGKIDPQKLISHPKGGPSNNSPYNLTLNEPENTAGSAYYY